MLPSRLARFASPAMLAVRPYRVALLLLVFLAALCPAAAPPQVLAAGTTITVTTTADEMNDNDTCSLREAVDAAGSNQAVGACPAGGSGVDLIILPAGTYTLSLAGAHEDYNLTGDLDVVASMRIEGAGAAQTIIDGGGIDRIFDITFGDAHWPTPDVTISGVTLRHGANPVPTWSWDILTNAAWPSRYSGGAIRNAGRLVIEHSVISGNQAQINGGAILSVTALTLTDTQVTGNVVRLDVTDSVLIATIDLVAALRGGAIVAQDQVTISQSAIDDNLGGGIFNVVGSLAISNSSVSRNQASSGDGAGIYNLGGTLTLSGSQIAANTSAGGGAGVVGVSTSGSDYTYSSAITIADSSITGNQAGGSGGGILLLEGANPGAKATNALTITNSLVLDDQAIG
ncbi:MAG: CSLREA domain-containing protein, partial [Oscillochloris sp.]|nr:CSLREA domain-containing protein [Oscillochloris sp.]